MRGGNILEERRMALHDLLDRILISYTDEPDVYLRIFKHEPFLKNWFSDRPSWRLLKGQGIYRLERLPSQFVLERGLPRLKTSMDYSCLCWTLWFAEMRGGRNQDWFVISDLAKELGIVSKGQFDLSKRSHRESLVRAMVLLVDLNFLVYNSGDAEHWVQGLIVDDADVLYEFAPDAPRFLSTFDQRVLEAVSKSKDSNLVLSHTGDEASVQARAWRMLLLGPAFWKADDLEAFDWLLKNSPRVRQDLEQALGWHLELRRDYALILRMTTAQGASAVLLDILPETSDMSVSRTIKYIYHPILLLIAKVYILIKNRELILGEHGSVKVSEGWLKDLVIDLYRQYRRNWGVELGERMGIEEVLNLVLKQMRRLGYLRGPDRLGNCYILPIAASVIGHYTSSDKTEAKVEVEIRSTIQQPSLFV